MGNEGAGRRVQGYFKEPRADGEARAGAWLRKGVQGRCQIRHREIEEESERESL